MGPGTLFTVADFPDIRQGQNGSVSVTHHPVDHSSHNLLNTPDCPFDGTTVVFGGDFEQILPAVHNRSRAGFVFASLPRETCGPGPRPLFTTNVTYKELLM